MMMLKRRCTGWRATCVAGGLIFFVAMNPASGGIISDRSAFVGDFTVIDFETLADGTPLVLDEGEIFGMFPQEYAAFGVTITSSGNIFGNEFPFISNNPGAQFDAAQEFVGSLQNAISGGGRETSLRFDFSIPVNAIGIAVMNNRSGLPVRLEVFDPAGGLIDTVDFQGNLVDGVFPGIDFGTDFDVEFGFLGYFAPDQLIGHALVFDDLTRLDDLHFGVIPETSTFYLLCSGLLLLLLVRKNSFVFRRGHTGLLLLLVTLASPGALQAETIHGTVTGYAMTSEDPICGDNGPPWCVQQPLQQVLLHGVRVCIPGGCTFTDAQGDYDLFVSGTTDIEADLDGEWTKVGEKTEDEFGNEVFLLSPPLTGVFDPANPPPNNRIDFVFNANPNPVLEIPTVEANIFYHTMFVRDFYLQRHPSFRGLDVQIASARNGIACTQAFFSPPAFLMSFPESGSQSGTFCIANADRSIVGHEYGHVIHNVLGHGEETAEAFREGFADTVALLVYDFPDLFIGHAGEGTAKSYDFAADPSLRIDDPCVLNQCPALPNSAEPDPNCCGSILAGIWWDIKLNMQAKYSGVGAPDCPIDPALNETDACGLKLTRQLFVDWSKVTDAGPVGFMLAEILDLDDDDGDLWNSSPNFGEICRAFRDHGIDCPFDCNEDGRHDLDNIVEDNFADVDENQIPDLCEGGAFQYRIAYVNAAAFGSNNGTSWDNAYTSLRVALQVVQQDGVDEIWVAAGRYEPGLGGDQSKSFVLGNGLRVYGGFVGGEGGEERLTQRDPVLNETILTGDLNGADCVGCPNESECAGFGNVCVDGCCAVPDNGENSHTVVSASAVGSSASTLLDGFTITAGNGSIGFPGGMFISGRPTVRNCRFVGNLGGGNGGGAVAFKGIAAKPLFQNCRFENNRVLDLQDANLQYSGGAVFFDSGSSPRFVDCRFDQNSAGNEGGAVASIDSAPTFIRCNFEGNGAVNGGGGLMIRRPDSRGRGASLVDCVFRQNSAGVDGGGLHVDTTSATLSGCWFFGNNAGNFGGGMYRVGAGGDKITITDCIFGGNTADQKGGAIYNRSSTMDVLNTLIVGNEAVNGAGGGVYAGSFGGGENSFVNCTISYNQGGAQDSEGDGMFMEQEVIIDLRNSILWANQGLDG